MLFDLLILAKSLFLLQSTPIILSAINLRCLLRLIYRRGPDQNKPAHAAGFYGHLLDTPHLDVFDHPVAFRYHRPF
jgi:hypothetical protein